MQLLDRVILEGLFQNVGRTHDARKTALVARKGLVESDGQFIETGVRHDKTSFVLFVVLVRVVIIGIVITIVHFFEVASQVTDRIHELV